MTYIDIDAPSIISYATGVILTGTPQTLTSSIQLYGTGIANEQRSVIATQYTTTGNMLWSSIYSGLVNTSGERSTDMTIHHSDGNIDLLPSYYDTLSMSGSSRKA